MKKWEFIATPKGGPPEVLHTAWVADDTMISERVTVISDDAPVVWMRGLCCKSWHRGEGGGMIRPDGDLCCVHAEVHSGGWLNEEWRRSWEAQGKTIANGLALDISPDAYQRMIRGRNLDITQGTTRHPEMLPPHRGCPNPGGCLCLCPGCACSQ